MSKTRDVVRFVPSTLLDSESLLWKIARSARGRRAAKLIKATTNASSMKSSHSDTESSHSLFLEKAEDLRTRLSRRCPAFKGFSTPQTTPFHTQSIQNTESLPFESLTASC
eukprot:scaffold473_cov257-Pinguiococcus_pyrenoidosus.AAC.7